MRYLVLSDIHADIRALERVLCHAEAQGWDEALFLGDVVGYGPEPVQTVERLMALSPTVALQGNHEVMVLAAARGEPPNARPDIEAMVQRHAEALPAESLDYLSELPRGHVSEGWGAVHGALRKPWEYLISVPAARANAPHMERPVYFVGHTHIAGAFVHHPKGGRWQSLAFRKAENRLRLEPGSMAFLNPGSVGRPRDGVRGASYGLFDEEQGEFTVFRLPPE